MGPVKAVKVKREIDYDERLERRLKRRYNASQKTKFNASSSNKNHAIIIDDSEQEDVVIKDCSLDDDGTGDKHQTSNGKATPDKNNIVDGVGVSRWEDDLQKNDACYDGHGHHNDAPALPKPTEKNVGDGVDVSKPDEDLQTFLNSYRDGNGYHTPKGYPSTAAVPNKKNASEAINIPEPDHEDRTFLKGYHGGDRSTTFVGRETDEVDKYYLKFLNVYCDGNLDAGTPDPDIHVYPEDTVVTGNASPEIHVDPDGDAVARNVHHDICVSRDDVPSRNSDPDIHDADSRIEDLEDPQYKLFLQKLGIDKKSYVLEVEVDYGITLLLEYECEEFNSPGPENLKTSTVKDKVDVARGPSSDLRMKNEFFETVKGKTAAKRSKMNDKSAPQMCVHSRESLESLEQAVDKVDVARGPSSALRRKNKFFETVKEKTPAKRSKMIEESAPQMCMQSRESLESFEQAVDKRQQLLTERDAAAKDANIVPAGLKKCCNLGPRQENLHCTEDEEVICDESFATFLQFIASDGEVLVLNHDGERVRYGEDSEEEEEEQEESSSDVMIIEKLDAPEPGEDIPGNSLYSAINLDDDECGEVPRRCHQSQFREKLLNILKMPYDAREHVDLLRTITFKRPKTYVRRLRNGMEKAYPAEGMGKSYLDLYTDLAEKVGLVIENQYKTLNLLRGFFYWLNNLPHQGVFRPWLDPACLSVLPSTSLELL